MKMMQPPPPNPSQQAHAKLQMEHAAIVNAKTAADARKSDAQAQKAIAEAGGVGDKTQLAAAELQGKMWLEALQLTQPPQQPQQAPPQIPAQ
jgi:hypothetical protein